MKTKKEKLEHLEKEIKKAEEEGDEEYLKYIMNIKKMTIYVESGGTLIMQSGSPPPPPPYVPPK